MATKVQKSEQEWREQLTPEQYEVTRKAGTERAFTGPYVNEKGTGMYTCVCCGTELFASGT
jgi:peptide-methionine (R)-S-oxide reductase